MTDTSRLGAKIGPRVVELTTKAMLATRQQTQGMTARMAVTAATQFFRVMATEARAAMGPVARELVDDDQVPEQLKALMRPIAEPTGEWQVLGAALAAGGVASGMLFRWIDNMIAPFIHSRLEEDPNQILDPNALATAVAEGRISRDLGRAQAAMSGLNADRFDVLVALADTGPAIGQALDAWNRGVIDEDEVDAALRESRVAPRYWDGIKALRRYIHTPEALAEMVMRNVLDESEATREARKVGMSPEQFTELQGIVGQPPGLDQLLFMFRRGIIERDRLVRGIRQSRYRNEWIDDIIELRFAPMSAGTAVNAAVQNHLTDREARRIWEENGLDPDHFEPALETAGNPPGIAQLAELWNRNKISEREFEQAIRESAYKNKYIDAIKEMARYIPPPRTVVALLRSGALDKRKAVDLLMDNGLTRDMAATYVESATNEKNAAERDLAKTEIAALYEAEALSDEQARGLLVELGYDDDEAEMILSLRQLRRERRYYELAIGRARSLFVAWRIPEAQAQAMLDQLGVPPTQRSGLLETWRIEREGNMRDLTQAQITGALKRGLIDEAETHRRLTEIGYSTDDADLLIALTQPAARG